MADKKVKMTSEERAILKAQKVAAKRAEFERTHFIIKYMDKKEQKEFTINPVYITDKDIIVFPALDKNGVVYAINDGGSLSFKIIPAYKKNSKKYGWAKQLIAKTGGTVKNALTLATSGLNFHDFHEIVKLCKTYKERESRGAETEIC